MSSDIIDLCGSESEEYERQPKRQRHNYDDDDSEVIVVEEETGNGDDQQDQPEESQQLGDDEELRIVGHTGQDARIDLPHTRDLCGVHNFTRGTNKQNKAHCDKCFCYICDVAAKDCTHWGEGTQYIDHCNAHSGVPGYRSLRAEKQRERQRNNRTATGTTAAGESGFVSRMFPGAAPGVPMMRPSVRSMNAQQVIAAVRAAQVPSTLARATDNNDTSQGEDCSDPFMLGAMYEHDPGRDYDDSYGMLDSGTPPRNPWSDSDGDDEYYGGGMMFHNMSTHPVLDLSRPQPDESEEEQAARLVDTGDPELNAILGIHISQEESEQVFVGKYRQPAPLQQTAGPKGVVGMPDPSLDYNMVEITRVEFPCKATGKLTLPQLRRKLVPHGAYLNFSDQYTSALRHGTNDDQLTLFNLLQTTNVDKNGKPVGSSYEINYAGRARKFLELLPMPVAETLQEPAEHRVRRVVVVHGVKAVTYGIRVEKDASIKDLMEATATKIGLRATEHLVAGTAERVGKKGNCRATILDGHRLTSKVSDEDVYGYVSTADQRKKGKLGIVFWRVPKVGEFKHVPDGTGNPAKYALVHHYAKGNNSPFKEQGVWPTLVPFTSATAYKGGSEANAVLLKDLAKILKPVLKPGQDIKNVKDYAALYFGAAISTEYAFSRNVPSNFPYYMHMAVRNRTGDYVKLTAVYEEDQAAVFDGEKWQAAPLHPSCSEAELEVFETYAEQYRANTNRREEAEGLPYLVCEELDKASIEYDPATMSKIVNPGAKAETNPIIRYKIDLIPSSSDPSSGKLSIRVFTWRPGCARKGYFTTLDSAFSSPEDALVNGRKRRRYHYDHDDGSSKSFLSLKNTMHAVLWNNQPYKNMIREFLAWTEKDKKLAGRRNITTLIQSLERGEMPAAEQPDGLTVRMHPYQLQSLKFMLDIERMEGGFRKLFWLPMKGPPSSSGSGNGFSWWYSPILGKAAVTVDPQPIGGFCAEEMGLGKTVEVLGLCLANPAPPSFTLPQRNNNVVSKATSEVKLKSRATLVVCAVSLVGQWIAEAESKLGGSLSIHMYHGSNRSRDPVALATKFDLVVTTYATLQADFSLATTGKKKGKDAGKKTPSPLHQVEWWRLVLDESHTARVATVGHTKACIALEAQRRWCCSGTPINTDVADLFGQFCVLKLTPFSYQSYFNKNVKAAYGNNVHYAGCKELMYVLGKTMVRHTKSQSLGGQQVLQLPPLEEHLVPVILTAAEQEQYKKSHEKSAQLFNRYRMLGPHQMSRHLLQIMSLLLPMRRICSGGSLRPSELVASDWVLLAGTNETTTGTANALNKAPNMDLIAPDDDECPICMDAYENPAVTPCNHWFCKECILGVLQAASAKCPLCRRPQTAAELRLGVTQEAAAEAAAKAKKAAEGGKDDAEENEETAGEGGADGNGLFTSESKLQALLAELRKMRRADPRAKALIFSQYNNTIEWLKVRLTQEGFGHRFISGSMPLPQRTKAIRAFQDDPPTTVFLLSMRSGAVGINLTSADHVFLLEPALNPALEDQAIGRAWRMGQRRTVKVYRFFVKGSVEERIMQLAAKRKSATGAVGPGGGQNGAAAGGSGEGGDADAAAGGSTNPNANPSGIDGILASIGIATGAGPTLGRNVHVQDLAGSIREDKQKLRAGELELLFMDPDFPPPRHPGRIVAMNDVVDNDDEEVGLVGGGNGGGVGRPRSAQGQPQQRPRPHSAGTGDDDEEERGNANGNITQLAPTGHRRVRRSRAGVQGGPLTLAPVVATALHNAAAGGGGYLEDDDDDDDEFSNTSPQVQRQQRQQRQQKQNGNDGGRGSKSIDEVETPDEEDRSSLSPKKAAAGGGNGGEFAAAGGGLSGKGRVRAATVGVASRKGRPPRGEGEIAALRAVASPSRFGRGKRVRRANALAKEYVEKWSDDDDEDEDDVDDDEDELVGGHKKAVAEEQKKQSSEEDDFVVEIADSEDEYEVSVDEEMDEED